MRDIIIKLKALAPLILVGANVILAFFYSVVPFNNYLYSSNSNFTILVVLVVIELLPRSVIDLDPYYSKWFTGCNIVNILTSLLLVPMYMYIHWLLDLFMVWLIWRAINEYA